MGLPEAHHIFDRRQKTTTGPFVTVIDKWRRNNLSILTFHVKPAAPRHQTVGVVGSSMVHFQGNKYRILHKGEKRHTTSTFDSGTNQVPAITGIRIIRSGLKQKWIVRKD